MPDSSLDTMRGYLDRLGFKIRGRRAQCIHCDGHSTFTVSFTRELIFCHRCKYSANLQILAKQLGERIEAAKPRPEEIEEREFQSWISSVYDKKADQERELHRKAALAHRVLRKFPDVEEAWQALKNLYDAEHGLEMFFEAARDQLGRRELFEMWRATRKAAA